MVRIFPAMIIALCCFSPLQAARAESPFGTAPNIAALLADQRPFDIFPRAGDTGLHFFNKNPFLPERFITISIWDLMDAGAPRTDGSAFGAGARLWNLIPRASR